MHTHCRLSAAWYSATQASSVAVRALTAGSAVYTCGRWWRSSSRLPDSSAPLTRAMRSPSQASRCAWASLPVPRHQLTRALMAIPRDSGTM